MKLKEIALTAYPTNDVAKLRDFYTEALGLQFSAPFEENGKPVYTEANVNGGYFVIMTAGWSPAEAGTSNSITFEVDDADAAKKELEAKGITVSDVFATSVCKMFRVNDPDGNSFVLHQTTVPH